MFLHMSTLLDPRFKDLPVFKEEYPSSVKQELLKMVETEYCVPYSTMINNSTGFDTNVLDNPRISGLCLLFVL